MSFLVISVFLTMLFLCLCVVRVYIYVSPLRTRRLEILDAVNENKSDAKLKRILWYNQKNNQTSRHVEESLNSTFFEQCEVKNCVMTFNKSDAPISDAVIINWLNEHSPLTFKRPHDQVWIFIQHESPISYWQVFLPYVPDSSSAAST